MMMVVGAGLMLGGVALGPYGAPVIAAGMALSIAAGVIALGMFIVNAIKNKREHDKARTSALSEDAKSEKDHSPKNEKKPPNPDIVFRQSKNSVTESSKEQPIEEKPVAEMSTEEMLEKLNETLLEIGKQLSLLEEKLKPARQPSTTNVSQSPSTLYTKKSDHNKTGDSEPRQEHKLK